LNNYCQRITGVSICWAAADADTQFANFDLSAPEKQLLIFFYLLAGGEAVQPGQLKTFIFKITAPDNPGTFAFQWQMLKEGVAWFGVTSSLINVKVRAPVNNASFVSQDVPSSMSGGKKYTVKVTMKNTGDFTWTHNDLHRLGSVGDSMIWGVHRVYLGSNDAIKPGQSNTFTFNVTAPLDGGSYRFQWRMLRKGIEWFGGRSSRVNVSVNDYIPPGAKVNIDYLDMDYSSFANASPRKCQEACRADGQCRAWTFVKSNCGCYLKNEIPTPRSNANTISGVERPQDPLPAGALNNIDYHGMDYT